MHCSYAPQVKSRQHLDILNFACRSIRPISIEYAILGLYTSRIQRDQPHQSASADQHGSPLSLHSAAALTAHHQLQPTSMKSLYPAAATAASSPSPSLDPLRPAPSAFLPLISHLLPRLSAPSALLLLISHYLPRLSSSSLDSLPPPERVEGESGR